jgi:hypothetical protein
MSVGCIPCLGGRLTVHSSFAVDVYTALPHRCHVRCSLIGDLPLGGGDAKATRASVKVETR